LILGKIINTVATRCHILKQKCTKFDFGCDPAGGAYSASPDHLAGFKGPYFYGKGGGREGKGREGINIFCIFAREETGPTSKAWRRGG